MFEAILKTIGMGADVGGAIYDRWSNRDEARDVEARNLHWSRRAIQDRVRDAERAGIHPLYALGASTSTPMAQAVMSDTGQQVASGINRYLDRPTRQMDRLSQALLEQQVAKTDAERRLVEQEIWERTHSRGVGSGMGDGGITLKDEGVVTGQADSGLYKVVPPERSTSPPGQPGVESGAGPAFRKYTLPMRKGGLEAMLPQGTDLGETLENIKWYMWPTIYKVNKDMYGEAHADKLWKWANPFGDIRVFKEKMFPAFRK